MPQVAQPSRDSSGDFSGIRPYVPGDRLRLLYWPALARSGELMVRDFEDAGSSRVHVVADVRPLVGEAGSERVLAAVAGIGMQVLAQGSVVELSTTAGERIAIGPGPLGAASLLRGHRLVRDPGRGCISAPPRLSPRPATCAPAIRAGRRAESSSRRRRRRAALVVTTADGVRALPGTLGFAHVVVAP